MLGRAGLSTSRLFFVSTWLAICAVCQSLGSPGAHAQTADVIIEMRPATPQGRVLIESHGGEVLFENQTAYIARIGADEAPLLDGDGFSIRHLKGPEVSAEQTALLLSNEQITVSFLTDGQFTAYRTSDQAWLLYPAASTSFFSVNVDGSVYANVDGTLPVVNGPTLVGGSRVETVYQPIPGLRIIQTLELAGPAVKMIVGAENATMNSHNVSVRHLLDTQISDNDGSPIFIPTSGVHTYELDLPGPTFATWEAWMRPDNPLMKGVGTLVMQPTRMVLAWWPSAYGSRWDYTPNPSQRFYTPGYVSSPESDSCVLIYQFLGVLAPASSHVPVVTCYGLGAPTGEDGSSALRSAISDLSQAVDDYVNAVVDAYAATVAPGCKLLIDDSEIRVVARNFALDLLGGNIQSLVDRAVQEGTIRAAQKPALDFLVRQLISGGLHVSAGTILKDVLDNTPAGSDASVIEGRIRSLIRSGMWGESGQGTGVLIAQLKQKLDLLKAAVPDGLELDSDVSKLVDAMHSISSNLRNYLASSSQDHEGRLYWSIPGSCDIDVEMNPLPIGAYGPNARLFNVAYQTYKIGGIVGDTRRYGCFAWGVGGGAVKIGLLIGGVTAVAEVPVEAVYLPIVAGCSIAGKVTWAIDMLRTSGLFFEIACFDAAMNSEVNLIDHFVREVADDVGNVVPLLNMSSVYACSNDMEFQVDLPTTANAGLFSDPEVQGTVMTTNLDPANSGVVRYFVEVYSKAGGRRSSIDFHPFEKQDVPSGVCALTNLDFSLPQPGIFGSDQYTIEVIAIGSAGIRVFTQDMTVCGPIACFFNSSSEALLNGVLPPNHAAEGTGYVPPSAGAAMWTLAYGGSDFDLHLYDTSGRHVGMNYQTGQFENQIPGASYSGSLSNPEYIRILSPGEGTYSFKVISVSAFQEEGYSVSLTLEPPRNSVVSYTPETMFIESRPGFSATRSVFLIEQSCQNASQITDFTIGPLVDSRSRVYPADLIHAQVSLPFGIGACGSVGVPITIDPRAETRLGVYTGEITVSYDDSEVRIPVSVTVSSGAVVADAGPDSTFECAGWPTTAVVLDGTGSYGPLGNALTYLWSAPGVMFDDPTSATPVGQFALGTTTVMLIVSTSPESADTDYVNIKIEDTTPPDIVVGLNRDVLWPPNHKMVDITATVTVTDDCCASPTFKLISITSNEPDNGKGDGNIIGDIQGADRGTADVAFQLRSERRGLGDGRIYTIVYVAEDCEGNSANATVEVRVPHDHAGWALASMGYDPSGSAFDPGFDQFVVIIPSRSAEYGVDGSGEQVLVAKAFDATTLDVARIYLGNTGDVIIPLRGFKMDNNDDGLVDLALYYSTAAATALGASSFVSEDIEILDENLDPGDGYVGLHYTDADGVDYLVENVLALGPAVPLNLPTYGKREIDEQNSASLRKPSEQLSGKEQVTALLPSYPNPFNPTIAIPFELASEGWVSLQIFDTQGRLIRTLCDEVRPAGVHQAVWDGRDNSGSQIATGVYFIRFATGDYQVTRKLVMIK